MELYFRPKLGIYKTKSGKNELNQHTGIATSYNWWKYSFLHPERKKTVVINMGFYSVTTSGHQHDACQMFQLLGYKVIKIDIGRIQLTWDSFVSNGANTCLLHIKNLLVAMNRRGSKTQSNSNRIVDIELNIRDLNELVALGAKFDIAQFEQSLAEALAVDFEASENRKNIRKPFNARMQQVKSHLANLSSIDFLSESLNNMNEIAL